MRKHRVLRSARWKNKRNGPRITFKNQWEGDVSRVSFTLISRPINNRGGFEWSIWDSYFRGTNLEWLMDAFDKSHLGTMRFPTLSEAKEAMDTFRKQLELEVKMGVST